MELAIGNIFVRPIVLPKSGDVVQGHKHNFDHATYCVRGAMRIERQNPDGSVDLVEIRAGDHPILIKEFVDHKITALVDDTLGHCIYAHRTPQGEVVQHWTGWTPAYA
jgi:cupin superfamily acireductone dioxygenase involved in methionine salvage